jgi:phosphoribosylaminoimidazole-succinocarboxamide synthase
MKEALMNIELPGIKLFKKGKVRDIYQVDDKLLIVASDRISAFDVVMPNGIPDKGRLLTQISLFWFEFAKNLIDNHLITADIDEIMSFDEKLENYKDILKDRSMLVKKTTPLPIECVVRGYLTGSGWKEYKETGSVSGVKLPKGLSESQKLPEPIFTPATKQDEGHDENIMEEQAAQMIGDKDFEFVRNKSIQIYKKATDFAANKGIIIADTKLEFGRIDDKLILIDEVLTPDSSRFWPKGDYETGRAQKSLDKQFTRDYLDSLDWDKKPPAPVLPDEIVEKTRDKYFKIAQLIMGKTL